MAICSAEQGVNIFRYRSSKSAGEHFTIQSSHRKKAVSAAFGVSQKKAICPPAIKTYCAGLVELAIPASHPGKCQRRRSGSSWQRVNSFAQGPQIVLLRYPHGGLVLASRDRFEMPLVIADEAPAYQPSGAGGFWYAPKPVGVGGCDWFISW